MGTETTKSFMELDGPGALETSAVGAQSEIFGQLRGLTDAGPGKDDVAAGAQSQRDLASLLDEFQKSGGVASEQDYATADTAATNLFAGSRSRLNNLFEDENQRTAQMAASLGRDVADPVLQAKLQQNKARETANLEGDQRSTAERFAQQLPQNRLNFANQKAQVLSGLSGQAFQNRAAIMSLGAGLTAQERTQRIAEGTQVTEKDSSVFDKIMQGVGVAGQLFSLGVGGFSGGGGGGSGSSLPGASNIGASGAGTSGSFIPQSTADFGVSFLGTSNQMSGGFNDSFFSGAA